MYAVKQMPNVRYQIDCVISVLNIMHLPKFENHLLNEGLIDQYSSISCNIAHEPLPLSITSIPEDMKKGIADYLREEYEKLPPAMKRRHRNSGWHQIINFMNNSHTWKRGALSVYVDTNLSFCKEELLEKIPIVKKIYSFDYTDDKK